MKYYVTIDRASIRKNPEWIDGSPNDQVSVPGRLEETRDEQGRVVSRTQSVSRFYTIGPCRPVYLYRYLPCKVE